MTEDEVLKVINNVAYRLAQRFQFGYHDLEDIAQQARLFAWEGLPNYDGRGPLENFLWIHVRNRLSNFKRNKYERLDKPCLKCSTTHYNKKKDVCEKYEDFLLCLTYYKWVCRNLAKKNLMTPIELSNVRNEYENYMKKCVSVEHQISYKEIRKIIDENLPIEMRANYLRMLSDVYISKSKRILIQDTIREILIKHGYSDIDV